LGVNLCGGGGCPRSRRALALAERHDGSHESEDQKATWQTLWPLLKPSGIYVIEDVQSDIGISELLRMIPDSNVENMRHVKNRWDDVLVWTVKQ